MEKYRTKIHLKYKSRRRGSLYCEFRTSTLCIFSIFSVHVEFLVISQSRRRCFVVGISLNTDIEGISIIEIIQYLNLYQYIILFPRKYFLLKSRKINILIKFRYTQWKMKRRLIDLAKTNTIWSVLCEPNTWWHARGLRESLQYFLFLFG